MKILKWFLIAALPTFAFSDESPVEKLGEHNAHLNLMAGTWDVKAKFRFGSDQTMDSTGVEIARLQPGGFWLISDLTSKFGDMNFNGHTVLDYEAHKIQDANTKVLKIFNVQGDKETLFMEAIYKRRIQKPAPKTKAGQSTPQK